MILTIILECFRTSSRYFIIFSKTSGNSKNFFKTSLIGINCAKTGTFLTILIPFLFSLIFCFSPKSRFSGIINVLLFLNCANIRASVVKFCFCSLEIILCSKILLLKEGLLMLTFFKHESDTADSKLGRCKTDLVQDEDVSKISSSSESLLSSSEFICIIKSSTGIEARVLSFEESNSNSSLIIFSTRLSIS